MWSDGVPRFKLRKLTFLALVGLLVEIVGFVRYFRAQMTMRHLKRTTVELFVVVRILNTKAYAAG